jgi:hypothetical protein
MFLLIMWRSRPLILRRRCNYPATAFTPSAISVATVLAADQPTAVVVALAVGPP